MVESFSQSTPPGNEDPEVRPTAQRKLADRIITAIAIGAYSPGDRLPAERELAEGQKVSRVTVRGALKIVRELGLIESRRGRDGGTFVALQNTNNVSPEIPRRMLADEIPKLIAFFDYRCVIEGAVARTAALRHDERQARQLESILTEFCDTQNLSYARELDVKFHRLITEMARNPHLTHLCKQMNARATLGFNSEPYPSAYLQRAKTIRARDTEFLQWKIHLGK